MVLPKVFCDLHHEDLFYSLQLLFEKRLGYEIYRPIGLDWYHQGYWNIFPHINTANQYLSTEGVPLSSEGIPVTEEHGEGAWINKDVSIDKSGIYSIPDNQHANSLAHRGITLDAFKDIKFDIIIASIPKHLNRFRELRDKFQPQAKLIFQAGNNWGNIEADNLLTSSKKCYSNKNKVFYHQEFDINEFKPGFCRNPRSIINLQHIANTEKLINVAGYLTDWDIKIYGASGRDGPVPSLDIPQVIRDAGFVWHVKSNEGYGYNIHHSFASGRPMVVDLIGNQGMTSGDLYESNINIIDGISNTPKQIANLLEIAADNHDDWCSNAYNKFKEVVDFNEEENEIRKFIENLI